MSRSKKNMFFILPSIILALLVLFSSISSNLGILYANDIDIIANAFYLFDANSSTELVEKDSNKHFEVASMVKLMTSLLTIEKIEKNEWDLEKLLPVSQYAASMEGSQAFLDAGKSYKIDDLLKSVIVASANDSSVVLAENYAGTENNFVDIMNTRAKELGMEQTLYANSTGLPSATNQYSTAHDIAILLKEVSMHDLYKTYSKIWMDKLVHHDGRETELVNTNRLIKYYPGCVCGKTGFTDEAGYCLSVVAEKNGMQLISVVMGAKSSSDRFTYSANLLNYGFSNFKSEKLVDKEQMIDTNLKLKGCKNSIFCQPKDDLFVVQKQGSNNEYQIEKEYNKLPKNVQKGDVLGIVKVSKNGEIICQTELLSAENYKTATYLDSLENIINNWSM